MFARHRIPPPPPTFWLFPAFPCRRWALVLLVMQRIHSGVGCSECGCWLPVGVSLFSDTFLPMPIILWVRGGSPAFFHPLVLVSVFEARFSSPYMVLEVPGFVTGAADYLQASPHVCRKPNDSACCKTNENRSRRRPIFVPSR